MEAFRDCSGLTSVIIGNSVTSIGESAFSGCSHLISVIIGSSVSGIANFAFYYCTQLKDVYCLAEIVPEIYKSTVLPTYVFSNYGTLHVPAVALVEYKVAEFWRDFKNIVAIEDGDIPGPDTGKCATPAISYVNKTLSFSCETEGVSYVCEIKDADVKKFFDSEITLTATYEISVYATKSGYENSDVATAALVWADAIFTETPTGPTAVRSSLCEAPALITTKRGVITVQSEANGQPIAVYGVGGQLLGSSVVSNGQATVSTSLAAGSVAIVKIGDKAAKVVVK